MKFKLFIFLFILNLTAFAQLPKGFVYLTEVAPDIIIELRYCSNNNFVGETIDGYNLEVCIVTKQTAIALKIIQEELKKQYLSLKIYDAYRPQRAVNHFWAWAKNINDTLMKQQFYPDVDKSNLFKEEYIATKSRHSSGSTVDITMVDLKTNVELDMGTSYDFFGKESWVFYGELTEQQIENRILLHNIMKKYGFRHYPKEWWHFTLANEPFKDQYFDFVIE